jgi:hypothetical protein
MRSPHSTPEKVYIVSPDGRIFATTIGEGITSRYVAADGRLEPAAEREGFRLLASFAKDRPGFLKAFSDFCEAGERGEVTGDVPVEHLPPAIVRLREKASKVWTWPALPTKKGKAAQ